MLNYNELKYIATKMANDGLTDYEKSLPPEELAQIVAMRGFGPETLPAPKPGVFEKYGPSVGIGAAGGALAGIPVGLLVNALTGGKKKKDLRSYLKSGLLGALLGGGIGALGGAGYKALGFDETNSGMSEGSVAKGIRDRLANTEKQPVPSKEEDEKNKDAPERAANALQALKDEANRGSQQIENMKAIRDQINMLLRQQQMSN